MGKKKAEQDVGIEEQLQGLEEEWYQRRQVKIWLLRNDNIREELEGLAKEEGVELDIPSWVADVPGPEKAAAAKRAICKAGANVRRRAAQREHVGHKRKAARALLEMPIRQLEKLGCSLVYVDMFGYRVAMAYKSGKKPNEVYVWFAICSPLEEIRGNRKNQWMHVAREILVDRVEEDDDVHSFACLIQGQSQFGPKTLDYFVKRRFIEYVMLTDKGLPRDLVKGLREWEKATFEWLLLVGYRDGSPYIEEG